MGFKTNNINFESLIHPLHGVVACFIICFLLCEIRALNSLREHWTEAQTYGAYYSLFPAIRQAFKEFLLCQQAQLQKRHGVVEHEMNGKLHWKNLGFVLLKAQVRLKIIRRRVYKENLEIYALPCLELESPGGV